MGLCKSKIHFRQQLVLEGTMGVSPYSQVYIIASDIFVIFYKPTNFLIGFGCGLGIVVHNDCISRLTSKSSKSSLFLSSFIPIVPSPKLLKNFSPSAFASSNAK